jgi:hypothetical protein
MATVAVVATFNANGACESLAGGLDVEINSLF